MTHTAQRAAIYVRISRDKAGEGLGVARQEKACRDLADRLAIPVGEVFTDNDKSATNGRARPRYAAMCKALASGRFSHVIAWSNDRLQRDLGETFAFGQLVDSHGVTVETVTAGTLDFVDPEKRVGTYVLSVLADAEVARRKRRMLAKHRELAEAGLPSGGPRRFGFEPDGITVRESEAEVIRELARRVLAGQSINSLCRDLNERGVPTSRGGAWAVTPMSAMLTSPRVAGYRVHRGDEFPAVWPAILDRRAHNRLVRRLATRPKAAPRTYRLSGLLVCADCQRGMVGTPSNGEAAYSCVKAQGGCGRLAKAAPVEAYLEDLTLEALRSGDLARRVAARQTGDASDAHARVEALEADLEALAADHGAGDLTRAEWQAARRPLAARLESARADLERLEASGGEALTTATLAAWRKAWSHDESARTAAMRGLLDRVEVGPGAGARTFRAERFDPVWAA